MRTRATSLLLLCSFATSTCAQDWDAYVSGAIRDARTKKPIPFATVVSQNQVNLKGTGLSRADAGGMYLCELYTGYMVAGGAYRVEFTAEGYQPCWAVLDLSEVEKGDDEALAWRIVMDIELEPGSGERGPPIAICQWDSLRQALAWTTAEARAAFPIEQYHEERITAHAARIDSLYALDGMLVDGVVSEHWTAERLADASIRVTAPGMDTLYRTDRHGYYGFVLEKKAAYLLEYGREGMVTKRLMLDLLTLPEADTTMNYRVLLDIRLFDELPGVDLGFLEQPMGVMRYDRNEDNLVWDMDISGPILLRLEEILSRHGGPKSPRR